jgi:hypothetical protein
LGEGTASKKEQGSRKRVIQLCDELHESSIMRCKTSIPDVSISETDSSESRDSKSFPVFGEIQFSDLNILLKIHRLCQNGEVNSMT